MKHILHLAIAGLLATAVHAQSLDMHWRLVSNEAEPGIVESVLTLTNNTADTLTADGGWFIGCCWMSVHPYHFDGELLRETEVCASYHIFEPTPDFIPLPPGMSYQYRLLQKGYILRENGGPQGAFYVAPNSLPVSINVTYDRFTSPKQWAREANPGYADGEWVYAYNEPYVKAISSAESFGHDAPAWQRPLHIVPEPKEVVLLKGGANLNANVKYKQNTKQPAKGYKLTINNKKILIEYADECGLFYAEQTLQRLRENNESLPAMCITDYPDLTHRGIMLDIARNFTPKKEIFKLLDAMAAYKLNVFHFHIVDDEAWRLEIPGLPELTDIASRRGYTEDESTCLYPAYGGGWNPEADSPANGYLTRDDYIDIVRYASERHIRVIPEIDMPGHSRAAIRAMEARYVKYAADSLETAEEYRLIDPQDTSRYSSAQHYTDNVICIARPSCYAFVRKVITELASMHEEAGQPLTVFHVGGDEVPKGAWKGSPMCLEFMAEHNLKNTAELKDYFLSEVLDILRPMGVKIGGWEEIAMRGGDINPRFAGDDVISWCWNSIPEWKGDEKAYRLANAGYPVVLACVGNLYLDMSYTNHQEERGLHWGGYTDEHSTFDFLPYDIYRSVRYTMKREKRNIDDYDRSKTLRLKPEARKNLYGIQGQLFAETIRSSRQVEEYIFPKLFGLAERAWNATPLSYRRSSSLPEGRKNFETERLFFSKLLYRYELPRISSWGIAFHLAQPGITVKEENIGGSFVGQDAHKRGKKERVVYINHPVPGAVIRYTTDGSDPSSSSPIYQAPFMVGPNVTIRAKAYYLGSTSSTTLWYE